MWNHKRSIVKVRERLMKGKGEGGQKRGDNETEPRATYEAIETKLNGLHELS